MSSWLYNPSEPSGTPTSRTPTSGDELTVGHYRNTQHAMMPPAFRLTLTDSWDDLTTGFAALIAGTGTAADALDRFIAPQNLYFVHALTTPAYPPRPDDPDDWEAGRYIGDRSYNLPSGTNGRWTLDYRQASGTSAGGGGNTLWWVWFGAVGPIQDGAALATMVDPLIMYGSFTPALMFPVTWDRLAASAVTDGTGVGETVKTEPLWT